MLFTITVQHQNTTLLCNYSPAQNQAKEALSSRTPMCLSIIAIANRLGPISIFKWLCSQRKFSMILTLKYQRRRDRCCGWAKVLLIVSRFIFKRIWARDFCYTPSVDCVVVRCRCRCFMSKRERERENPINY